MSGSSWTPGTGPTEGDDTFIGSSGGDRVGGLGGNDNLAGLGGDDLLFGDGGNNLLDGGDGSDGLFGSVGDDTLIGGAGDDDLYASSGNNLVIWRVGDGNDAISLSSDSSNDTISLEGWTGDDTDPWTTSSMGPLTFFQHSSGATVRATFFNAGEDIVTCFAEGTRIATARGEVLVETLRVGDLVVTAHGTGAPLQPIAWIGHTRAAVARHPDRAAIAPILIRAGALADGVPARDLRVSPEHAMFLDGCLVPARLLVNGATIIQETWCPEVTYWHVELPAHGLLVAEGAVSESYFDDGNRKHFDNAQITTLVKDFGSERANGRYAEAACRPLLLDGPALDRLRMRIDARGTLAQPERRSA